MSILSFLNRDTWIQGYSSRDATGQPCHSIQGCKWCLLGAIEKISKSIKEEIYLRVKLRKIIGLNIIDFNDAPERTWEEVEAAIKEAGI